jgi:cysteine protease ATG4
MDAPDDEDDWVVLESDNANCILPSVLNSEAAGVGWGSSLMQRAKTRLYMSLGRAPKELPESAYEGGEPLWLLGCCCSTGEFKERAGRLFWFSYRQGFPPIEPTSLTSDTGWGCVLRSGQMLLATALSRMMAARGKQDVDRRLLPWFADLPGPAHPYSVHNIAQLGTLFGIKIGEWFQPSIIAKVLKLLVRKYSPLNATFYYAQDRVIYRHNVELLCTQTDLHSVKSPRLSPASGPSSVEDGNGPSPWRPVIIMAPVRLGVGDSLNVTHAAYIQEMFRIPYCIGIVGGKPNASVYIVGMQGNVLFYLDPHFVQPVDAPMTSHHASVLKMPVSDMDPCFAIGFLCMSTEEFEALCGVLLHLEERDGVSCVLSVADYDPEYSRHDSQRLQHQQFYSSLEDPLAHLVFRPSNAAQGE